MTRAQRLASWAWQQPNPKLAIVALQRAVALAKGEPAFLKALAVKQAQALLISDAVDTLNQLVRQTAGDIEAWCMLGELSLDRGDYQTAARALGVCIQLDAKKVHPCGIRARALVHRTHKQRQRRTLP